MLQRIILYSYLRPGRGKKTSLLSFAGRGDCSAPGSPEAQRSTVAVPDSCRDGSESRSPGGGATGGATGSGHLSEEAGFPRGECRCRPEETAPAADVS